jgi:pimeloyl-ACP methyl ester carboxylesterase
MAEGRFIDVNGIRTHYVDRGCGPTVVLFHGAAFAVDAMTTWHFQLEALSRRYRVVAFDQIGFGYTDMPADGIYRNRLSRVDHAIGFLEAMGIRKAALVGHSEGAFVATRIALSQPTIAEGLVIMSSGGTAPAFGDNRDRKWMAASASLYDYSGTLPSEDAYIAGLGRACFRVPPETERYARAAYRQAVKQGQHKIFSRLPASETDYCLYTQLQAEHIHPYLKSLAAPTLLLWSKDDPTVPVERGVLLCSMIPQADFYVLSGTRHMIMIDRPHEVNELLSSWLARVHDRGRPL